MRGESSPTFAMECTVASGLGRGAQFLAIDWVLSELHDKVGLSPFPGTLNLRISPAVWSEINSRRAHFIKIEDPGAPGCAGYVRRVVMSAKGRAYSAAYLILPELSMYKDVLEIIAAENLREKLDLQDGDAVRIEDAQED